MFHEIKKVSCWLREHACLVGWCFTSCFLHTCLKILTEIGKVRKLELKFMAHFVVGACSTLAAWPMNKRNSLASWRMQTIWRCFLHGKDVEENAIFLLHATFQNRPSWYMMLFEHYQQFLTIAAFSRVESCHAVSAKTRPWGTWRWYSTVSTVGFSHGCRFRPMFWPLHVFGHVSNNDTIFWHIQILVSRHLVHLPLGGIVGLKDAISNLGKEALAQPSV